MKNLVNNKGRRMGVDGSKLQKKAATQLSGGLSNEILTIS
jgi:hypothetical protein